MRATAEAPAKVIITGEHFVVHGALAMAAAVGRRVRAEVADSDSLGLRSDRFAGEGHPALAPAGAVVRAMAKEFSFRESLSVDISSGIPEGAGLGSSAATMVATAAAVSSLKSLGLGRDELVRFAMEGEREVHGRPSGIDPAVCAYGGVILFRRGERPRRLRLPEERRFLVVHSGRRRSTKRLISRVSGARERNPGLFEGLAEAATEITKVASDRLREGEMRGLGRLMTFNHAVLAAVGASTPRLDGLVDLLLSMGCPGAKLTGAGGGGSVLAIPPERKEKSTIRELQARGFDAFEASIPVGGVRSWRRR